MGFKALLENYKALGEEVEIRGAELREAHGTKGMSREIEWHEAEENVKGSRRE